jgi:hypothetical protein
MTADLISGFNYMKAGIIRVQNNRNIGVSLIKKNKESAETVKNYTDKIFLKYKEIRKGPFAKSYNITNGLILND